MAIEIKHEDVFKFFWKVKQIQDEPRLVSEIIFIKYIGYIPETKKYYFAAGPDNEINGVELSFFQDKISYEYPPE